MSSALDHANGTSSVMLDAASIAGLKRLAARADDLLALLDLIGSGIARGPEIADNVNGLVQLARSAGGLQGEKLTEITKSLAQLRELVTSDSFNELAVALQDPTTGENLVKLLARSGDLAALVNLLDAFLKRGPEFADNINGLVAMARGLKVPEQVPALFDALQKLDYVGLVSLTNTLYPILASPQVQTLLTRTDILGEGTLALVNAAAQSALDAQAEQTRTDARTGPIGVLRGLGDPDVQRTIAFALDLAKRFGAKLRTGPALPNDLPG